MIKASEMRAIKNKANNYSYENIIYCNNKISQINNDLKEILEKQSSETMINYQIDNEFQVELIRNYYINLEYKTAFYKACGINGYILSISWG